MSVTCRNQTLAEDDFAVLRHDSRKSWFVPTDVALLKEAATVLGIGRSTLYEKIKKYEIQR